MSGGSTSAHEKRVETDDSSRPSANHELQEDARCPEHGGDAVAGGSSPFHGFEHSRRRPSPQQSGRARKPHEGVRDDAGNSSDGSEVDALSGLRRSTEYRAAWDMELWKAVQAERFRQQLERQRANALVDLARTVKQKEEAAMDAIAQRSAAIGAKEARLEREWKAVAQQKARLAEGEKGLRRMRQQLLDAQRRVEDEVRAQVRRANDDITHKALMLQERVKTAEAQAQRAEERQRQAQADYLELHEAFHRYRTQQLTGEGRGAAGSGGSVRPSTGEDPSEQAAAQTLRLRLEHQEEMRLLRESLQQQHREELAEILQQNKTLTEQNRRLTGALARRREQLRSHTSGGEGGGRGKQTRADPPATSQQQQLHRSSLELTKELERLRRERTQLVKESAGAITEGDLVMRRLDARIHQLADVLLDMTLTS